MEEVGDSIMSPSRTLGAMPAESVRIKETCGCCMASAGRTRGVGWPDPVGVIMSLGSKWPSAYGSGIVLDLSGVSPTTVGDEGASEGSARCCVS